MAKAPPIKNGRQTRIFNTQLTDINLYILKERGSRSPTRRFITKDDLRFSFDQTKGCCAYCGLKLVIQGDAKHQVDFAFFIPLKNGGAVDKSNIIPVCRKCKRDQGRAVFHQALERIYDYNTVPDIIQRLVIEVLRKEGAKDNLDFYRDSVDRLKRELNAAIKEFVNALAYAPRVPSPNKKAIEGKSTIADFVEEIVSNPEDLEPASGIADALKDIMISKRYRIFSK